MDVRLKLPGKNDIENKKNLQIMSLPAALIACAPGFYLTNALEARAVLSMISDASEILHKLIEGGHSTVAGRLAGAIRNIGKNAIAGNIIATMRAAGYGITENDPFNEKPAIIYSESALSP
jgi:hypothetical protein